MRSNPRPGPARALAARLALAGLACWMGAALAQAPAKDPGPGHRGPPPQALAACKALTAGQACSFVGHGQRSVSGTCWAPEGLPLACRPKDAPPPPPPGAAASRPGAP